ncbi:dephospho-CoA kinase [Carboxylicivirga marina]|uniref:Dephospho-CoA kinase n=1 Tax=Carboxylicivirga marina TaxID=2800988 RepID=A0ABS1HNT2_9BACT|nr:dephospho-CoA kinase [Carboxylicivirga marina]MBK3519355.1 dephospho-CoA kinase [Carboxylicivirga marina]
MIVGLTGGIGSGKSTVAMLLRQLGLPVYEADVEAKMLINSDDSIRRAIIELLGDEAYTKHGYNRPFVANKVFNNSGLLSRLNQIVHPVVSKHFSKWVDDINSSIVFQEAAILFENGSYKKFDKNILVTAPLAIRTNRVMKRDGFSEDEVKIRISRQWTDEAKIQLTDYIIKCDGKHLVMPQVFKILKDLGWDY